MNAPSDIHQEVSSSVKPLISQVEKFVHDHPTAAVLATVGIGCALGVLARSLLTPPPTPKHRALQVLEDIQSRLSDLLEPTYRQAGHIAEDGANAVRKGIDTLHDFPLSRKLKGMFN